MNDTLSHPARADPVNNTDVCDARPSGSRDETEDCLQGRSAVGIPPRPWELIMAIRPRASAYEYTIRYWRKQEPGLQKVLDHPARMVGGGRSIDLAEFVGSL